MLRCQVEQALFNLKYNLTSDNNSKSDQKKKVNNGKDKNTKDKKSDGEAAKKLKKS